LTKERRIDENVEALGRFSNGYRAGAPLATGDERDRVIHATGRAVSRGVVPGAVARRTFLDGTKLGYIYFARRDVRLIRT
jgi:hypothetical protein